jgi:hypothetical protein
MASPLSTIVCALCGCVLVACDDQPAAHYPYAPRESTVIGAALSADFDGGGADHEVLRAATYPTPSGEGCVELVGKNGQTKCLKPQKDCGDDGTADVIVNEAGDVLAVICYPGRDYAVQIIPDDPVESPVLGNNSVVVLDGKDDGADIEGDLRITGNNVIVYGEGPDGSVIGGDLQLDKNNAIVRGLRVVGDAHITKNNASLIDCVVEGDLIVTGNNVNIALCEVWGTLTIDGNNAVLVSSLLAGDHAVTGKNLRCNDNHRFTDSDDDEHVDEADLFTPATCTSL